MQDPPKAAPQLPYRLGSPTALFNFGPASPVYPVAAPPATQPPAPRPRASYAGKLRRMAIVAVWIAVGAASTRLLWPAAETPRVSAAPLALPENRPSIAAQPATPSTPARSETIASTAPEPAELSGATLTANILATLDRQDDKRRAVFAIEQAAAATLPIPLAVPVPVESVEELAAPDLEMHAEAEDAAADFDHEALLEAILAARARAAEPGATAVEERVPSIADILAVLEPSAGGQAGAARAPATPLPSDPEPIASVDAWVAPDLTADGTADEPQHEAMIEAILAAAAQTASEHAAEPQSAEAMNDAAMAAILAALAPPEPDSAAIAVIHAASDVAAPIKLVDEPALPPVVSDDKPAILVLDHEAVATAGDLSPVVAHEAMVEAILLAATQAAADQPAPAIAQAPQPQAVTPPPQPSASPAPSAEAVAQAARFLQRGDEYLQTGDIAAARLFYERAARAGIAQAMTALARTYDPNVLRQRGVVGLTADPARAQFWYGKAAEAERAAANAPKQP